MVGVSGKRSMAPSERSITKTEIALYVLLAVLAIAVAVLAAHCAVHHLKRTRYGDLRGVEGPIATCKACPSICPFKVLYDG